MVKSRLNLIVGLIEICTGLCIGMLMASERDLHIIENLPWGKHVVRSSMAEHWLELAHAHFGMLGIINLLLSFLIAKPRIVQIGIATGGVIVPFGFILWLYAKELFYINLLGSAILFASLIYVVYLAIYKRI